MFDVDSEYWVNAILLLEFGRINAQEKLSCNSIPVEDVSPNVPAECKNVAIEQDM